MRDWAARLQQRHDQGLYRHRRLLSSAQGPRVELDGQTCLNFSSNDYLGLANHPAVAGALRQASETMGTGGGASHLVCGHHQAHHDLEQALARFTGREAVLLFSTGYMANLGVISAVAGRGDLLLQDRLNHASLLDAALLSRARLQRYGHGDADALEALLQRSEHSPASTSQRFIVTDGVFSMDGDLAPLGQLAASAQRHDALLIVDDAHGFGILGQGGRGIADHYHLGSHELPLLIGTLGKAFGTAGAFVAGSRTLIDYLIQFARTYIYTTAMPPAIAAASLVSLQLCETEDWRRQHLNQLIEQFRAGAQALGYTLMPSMTAIQPILIGDSRQAMRLSAALQTRGIAITAIRPPTVPEGSARLRVTLSAGHSEDDLARLLEALAAERPLLAGARTGSGLADARTGTGVGDE